jgi:hypothetical protein
MADEEQLSAEDRALFEAEVERLRQEESSRAREDTIKAAARRIVDQESEQEWDRQQTVLDDEVANATTDPLDQEQSEARRETPSKVLLLAIVLILLIFILAATGQLRPLLTGSSGRTEARLAPKSALSTALDWPTTTPVTVLTAKFGEGVPTVAAPAPAVEGIDPLFATYYGAHDGLRVFGLPLSGLERIDDRNVQWFERARLEHWPEHAGTPYEIQPGLVGREYTVGRDFPTQSPFADRPGLRFFAETSHGLGGHFLEFWSTHGGVDMFGYPISDEIPEALEDGIIRNVQYFERARLEWHPGEDGQGGEVLIGLLGRALLLQEPRPEPLAAPAPTAVPEP